MPPPVQPPPPTLTKNQREKANRTATAAATSDSDLTVMALAAVDDDELLKESVADNQQSRRAGVISCLPLDGVRKFVTVSNGHKLSTSKAS